MNLDLKYVQDAITKLKKNNLKVSLFIDPTLENINKSKNLEVSYIELHTGKYADLSENSKLDEIKLIEDCAKYFHIMVLFGYARSNKHF